MVARLDEVAAEFDPAVNLDAPFALTLEDWGPLNGSRLLPLVERVRTGRFAELATRELTTALGEVGQVGAGFSNGSGIYEWFIPGPVGRRIGWQIQDGAFRLAVIGGAGDPRVKAGLEELVATQYQSYFDFTLPEHLSHALSRSKSKKQWLGYRPSFVYRYAEITPATTWRDLLSLVQWFSPRALEFAGDTGEAPTCAAH
jgi:hypothetical protein